MNTLQHASPTDSLRVEFPLGKTVRARYRLDALLGRGAMGSVYRAWDLERQTDCAVKLLQVESSVREAALIRFRDEARMAAKIFHPHVVEILDHGVESDGSPFIVMELLKGQDLDALLRTEVRLSIEQTLQVVTQIGSALHAIHQVGIVHRDIKPRNVFLVQSPSGAGGFQVKIIDFGLAKHLFSPPGGRGSDGLLIGTPEYLPPEAWRGVSSDVDTRADQWALAVLTFRILTGRLPFESHLNTMLLGREILSGVPRRIQTFAPEIPEHMANAIERAMAKDKHARFESIHDFIRALSNLPLTTNSMNTAGTEFLPIVVVPKGSGTPAPETVSLKREASTKIVVAPELTMMNTALPTVAAGTSVPWISQTCLLPSTSASSMNGSIHGSGWYSVTSFLHPATRVAMAAVVGGLLAFAIYAGIREPRAAQRGITSAQPESPPRAQRSMASPLSSPSPEILSVDKQHPGQKDSDSAAERKIPRIQSVPVIPSETRSARRSSSTHAMGIPARSVSAGSAHSGSTHAAKRGEVGSTSAASFGYPKAAEGSMTSARSPAPPRGDVR